MYGSRYGLTDGGASDRGPLPFLCSGAVHGQVWWKMLSLVVAMVKVVNDVADPPEHPLSPPFGLSFINP